MLNRGNRQTVTAAVDAVRAGDGDVVADIGFGGAVGIDLLLGRVGPAGRVYGIEISSTMLADARRRFRRDVGLGRLELHEASIEQLPMDDNSLDGLITTNTIYFIDDLQACFAEFARVLRPSGRIVLGLGDPTAMAKMPFTKHRFQLRPMAEVIDHLHHAGLQIAEDLRVGNGENAFHLLVAVPSAAQA